MIYRSESEYKELAQGALSKYQDIDTSRKHIAEARECLGNDAFMGLISSVFDKCILDHASRRSEISDDDMGFYDRVLTLLEESDGKHAGERKNILDHHISSIKHQKEIAEKIRLEQEQARLEKERLELIKRENEKQEQERQEKLRQEAEGKKERKAQVEALCEAGDFDASDRAYTENCSAWWPREKYEALKEAYKFLHKFAH